MKLFNAYWTQQLLVNVSIWMVKNIKIVFKNPSTKEFTAGKNGNYHLKKNYFSVTAIRSFIDTQILILF